MKYLYDFKLFEEVRLIDVSNIRGDNELATKFRNFQNNIVFRNDAPFIKDIGVNWYINGERVHFKMMYANGENHSILKRIKQRTNLKSTSEFNEKLSHVINMLIPDKLGTEIKAEYGKFYSVYLENSHYTIIFAIKYNQIMEGTYTILLKTIITGKTDFVGKLIIIDD